MPNKNLELLANKIELLSHAANLPFCLKDINASQDISKSKAKKNNNAQIITVNKCLSNRSLHLRSTHACHLMRVIDSLLFNFSTYLRQNNFLEIKTPKLIEGSSESGANLFSVNFFDRKAFLAQSPQLYKQMAVIGGLQRVFEINPVFRAEESNTNRYLSEFTGVDLEIEVSDLTELVSFVYGLMYNVLSSVVKKFEGEVNLDLSLCEKPVILEFKDCIELLKKENIHLESDINRAGEKVLGQIVKQKYGTDMFVIVHYPTLTRAFYTKPMDEKYSYSYDIILRGEEILSGSLRITNKNELIKATELRGINPESLIGYLTAFEFGVPPHGGAGIGLERVAKALMVEGDIRILAMFPRDPTRLYP